ncbi:glycosyltransferase [Mucilaginibacter sp. CSA2-8R]|uniref:glycosyltransferase family 2 protein n=1 Tax=Mucilaginibacter sp. CSA2-8R TaxID=3141542 RepID=UPI00315DDCF6
MLKKSVSIIIPNYNGRQLLEQYLPYTLHAVKNSGAVYEVIVVDDCSKDDSVAYLRSQYPDINVLVNAQNGGFSYTCNQGIQAARMDLILLLNSDIKLSPDYFDQQWRYFDREDTFGVMGRITDIDGPRIQDAARMPKFNGFKLKTAYFYYRTDQQPALTLYLSGANALVDAQKLKAMGGFNETFSPFYAEDFELSLRAWRLNWKCYYEHQSVCGHEVSASTKNYKTARWVKMVYFRNRYYLHALHLGRAALALWFLQITLIDLLPKIITGKFWMLESYTSFLKNLSQISGRRKQFKFLMQQHHSTTTVSDVFETISKSVEGAKVERV